MGPEALKSGSAGKLLNGLGYAMQSDVESIEIPEAQVQIDLVAVEACKKQLVTSTELGLDELGLGKDVRDVKIPDRVQADVGHQIKEIQGATRLE